MTLWGKNIGLICGLALLFFACEEPGEIGIDLNPENGVFVARYLEIPIQSTILQQEEVVSDNTPRIDRSRRSDPFRDVVRADGRLLVGGYDSPEFGKMKSSAFTGLYLASIGFKGEDYIFDSLVMFLRVDYL